VFEIWTRVLPFPSFSEQVVEGKYFERPLRRRLAFREFGTILGIKSHAEVENEFRAVVDDILRQWEESGVLSGQESSPLSSHLEPITLVMYAAALHPGGNAYTIVTIIIVLY